MNIEPPIKRRKLSRLLNDEEVLIEEKESTSWTCFGDHRCCALECGHVFGYKCIFKWLNIDNYTQCPTCKKTVSSNIVPLRFEGSITDNLRQFFFYEWQHEIKRVKRELRLERQRKEVLGRRLGEMSSKITNYFTSMSSTPETSSTATSSTTEFPLGRTYDENQIVPPPPPRVDLPNQPLPPPPPPYGGRPMNLEWLSNLKSTVDLYEDEDKEYFSQPKSIYSMQKSINLASFSQFFLFLNSDPSKILVDSVNDGNLNQHFLNRGNEVVVRIRILNSDEGERVVEMKPYHQLIGILSSFGRVLLVDLQTNRFIHTITLPDGDLGSTMSFTDAMSWKVHNNKYSVSNSTTSIHSEDDDMEDYTYLVDQTERVQGYYVIIGSESGKLYFYDQRDWSVPIRMYDVGSVVQSIHPLLWQKKQMLQDPKNYQINSVFRVEGTPYVMISYGRFGLYRCHVIKEVIEKVRVGLNILSTDLNHNNTLTPSSSEPFEYSSHINVLPVSECFSDCDRMRMMSTFIGDESIQTYFFKDLRQDQKYELFKFHVSSKYRHSKFDYPWKRYPSVMYSTKLSGPDVMGASRCIQQRRFFAQGCGDRTRIYNIDDHEEVTLLQCLENHEFEVSHIRHLNTLSTGHFLGEISRNKFCLYSLNEKIL